VLASVKEALAVAPSSRVVNLVAVWDSGGGGVLTPISHGAFERARLAGVDWSHEATRILVDVAPDSALEVKGVAPCSRSRSSRPASHTCVTASGRSPSTSASGSTLVAADRPVRVTRIRRRRRLPG
jgi:hypothetical protein